MLYFPQTRRHAGKISWLKTIVEVIAFSGSGENQKGREGNIRSRKSEKIE